MFKKAKIFFGLSALFLTLVVFSPAFSSLSMADNTDTLQVVNSGTLSFLDIPEDFSFSSLASSSSAQTSTNVPEEGAASTGDLIVQDLRFNGGFSVTLQATAFTNQFDNSFNCNKFAFMTFNTANVEGIEVNANVIPDTADVVPTYNSGLGSPVYTNMTATDEDPLVCDPVEILSGGVDEGQGRIGTWKVYPAYKLTVPAFAPPGTYASTITFTLVDDTASANPFGEDFALTSSNPSSGATAYYQSGNQETAFLSFYDVPSYAGDLQVDLRHEICTTDTLTTCATAQTDEDVYGSISNDGGGQAARITKGDFFTALDSLSITSGQTAYYRLRLVEVGGETIYTNNNYSFVATEDVVNGATDEWDSGDDVLGGAIDLGVPTTSTQTHGGHTLSDADYYDWFKFSLTDTETYNFKAVSGTGDTYGELYDDNGNSLDISDNDSGDGLMFSLSPTATYTGVYHLRVRCAYIGADCAYTLSYNVSSDSNTDDAYDPADDLVGGATNLATPGVGFSPHGPHTLSSTDDYDWFRFDLVAGDEYNFTAQLGTGDTYGELYSDAGITRVGYDDDSGGGLMFGVNYTPLSSGTYYFRARCFSVGTDCSYTFQVQRIAG